MLDLLGPGTVTGYCSNVHAGGACLAGMLSNLERHTLRVKERVSPEAPMGIGLWLAARTAAELAQDGRAEELARWLDRHGLIAFTINGFPYSDFHQPVVKYRVYEPDWRSDERLAYTRDLAAVLAILLPPGGEGSISTVPVGWRRSFVISAAVEQAARQLLRAAEHLARLEEKTGKLIHLDLEPEPGCYLEKSADVVRFFGEHLLASPQRDLAARYLRVCHDVCHAAVMFEDQAEVLDRYRATGAAVGKVQISSAVRADFAASDPRERAEGLDQLRGFQEDRYLHQTTVRPAGEALEPAFFDDLPEAIAARGAGERTTGEWRVHFHVPLFLERFGFLATTQRQILDCLAALGRAGTVRHFEVETYAWGVLPEALRRHDLAAGIAEELSWLSLHAQGGVPA